MENFSQIDAKTGWDAKCGRECSSGRSEDPSCQSKEVPRTHCNYFVNVCLWQWVNAYGISDDELEAYMDEYFRGAEGWTHYAEHLSKLKNNTDGKFWLMWYGKNPGDAIAQSGTIIQNLKPGDILVFDAAEGSGTPHHVEYYVGKENDKASFVGINQGNKTKETEEYEIYSNGLDKLHVKDQVNTKGKNWLIGVIRPIAPNNWKNI